MPEWADQRHPRGRWNTHQPNRTTIAAIVATAVRLAGVFMEVDGMTNETETAATRRELLPWMELTQDEIDALLPDHWSHYQRGGCLCLASYDGECACGAWSAMIKEVTK